MKSKNKAKIGLSILFGSLSIVLLTTSIFTPTNYFRDVFFYADQRVLKYILSNGQIPNPEVLEFTNYWGKIGSRSKLPIMPLLIFSLHKISGVSASIIYTLGCGFLVNIGIFFILYRRLKLPAIPALLCGTAAGISLPATVLYTVGASSLLKGMLYAGYFFIGLSIHNVLKKNRGAYSLQIILPLSIVLVAAFYWYPPNFAMLAAVSAVVVIAPIHKKAPVGLLATIVLSGFLFMLIFEIPLTSYVYYSEIAIVQFSKLQFALPTSGAGTTIPTSLSRNYYSLLPLPVLFLVATFGGYKAIRGIIVNKSTDAISMLAVIWGIAVIIFSLLYLATASSWLTGRVYTLSQPVLFLGFGIALVQLKTKHQITLSSILVTLVLISFVLQAGTPAIQIQTYQPGIETGSQWAGTHSSGPILSDLKGGAPMAAEGNYDAVFPEQYQSGHSIFYTTQIQDYCRAMGEYDSVFLYDEMSKSGIYFLKQPQKPIPEGLYELRIQYSSKTYSNGEGNLLQTPCYS
jgi:hypothetical protein